MKNKVIIYSFVIPAKTKSGAQVRIFSNMRAYLDLGYEVEFILFSNQKNSNAIYINNKEIPVKNILINDSEPVKHRFRSFSKKSIKQNTLNIIFPSRPIVESILLSNLNSYPDAIHHFEYLTTACATVNNNGNFKWSNHDHISERFLMIQKYRRKEGKKGKVLLKYGLDIIVFSIQKF